MNRNGGDLFPAFLTLFVYFVYGVEFFSLIPTLCVGTHVGTLCVPSLEKDATQSVAPIAFPRGAWEREGELAAANFFGNNFTIRASYSLERSPLGRAAGAFALPNSVQKG